MDGSERTVAAREWLRLVQAVSFCGRQFRKKLAELSAPHALNDTSCLILWACFDTPPEGRAQHELAALLGVSPAQLSGLVDQLGAQGYLMARRPAHDRRRQYWRLTPAGRDVVENILAAIASLASALAGSNHRAPRVLAGELTALAQNLLSADAPRGKEAA
jgi:DNA-binding MarR family transcriptional regulator